MEEVGEEMEEDRSEDNNDNKVRGIVETESEERQRMF
jgi:hypothetical protein